MDIFLPLALNTILDSGERARLRFCGAYVNPPLLSRPPEQAPGHCGIGCGVVRGKIPPLQAGHCGIGCGVARAGPSYLREIPLLSRYWYWATAGLAVGLRACVLPTGKSPPLAPLRKIPSYGQIPPLSSLNPSEK